MQSYTIQLTDFEEAVLEKWMQLFGDKMTKEQYLHMLVRENSVFGPTIA